MQIDDDRARLKNFLMSDTDLAQKTTRSIVRQKLIKDAELSGISNYVPQDDEINEFINKNKNAIQKEVIEVLDDICRKVLPEKRLMDLVVQFGILSIFLVPSFTMCIRHAVVCYQKGELMESGELAGAGLLVLALIIASAIEVFKK